MATADFAPVDHSIPSPVARGIHAIGRWFATRRVARAKRDALESLLFAPEYRLRDMGLTREQLIQTIADQHDGILLLR